MADKLGVTPDEAVGLSCYKHVHGTQEPPQFCPHKKLLLDGQEHVAEVYENRLGGIFQVSVTPFHDNDGKLIGSVHMARDITRQKQAEEILATERRRLADIIQGTNVGTWEWNVQTGKAIFNEQWARIIGYTLEEISPVSIDTWIKFAHPDDLKMSDELLEKHFKGELDYYECEARMRHKNGDWVWVLDRGKVATWTKDGKPLLMSGTHQDITERKRSEQQVNASLKEKEILLREIHHRVKNNLAVISSLLSMQANIVSDRQVHTALQESQSRVNAMALIHETLHQSESLALVDLENYVKDLVGNIVNTFEGISGRINFEIEVPDIRLEANQAVPCGLIINELATNAIKHAFANGQNGVVRINAKYVEDNKIELTVSDNGVGFSEELDWIKSKSLGLRLISLLVDQLHGTLDIKNLHGTQATIRWPIQTI
jgi:PAS domain S-box-containing protein